MNANFTDLASGLTDCLTRDGQAPMTAPLLLINGSSSVPSLAFAADPTNGLYRYGAGVLGVPGDLQVSGTVNQAGNPLVPAGTIVSFAGSSAPAGWFLCYGQEVSRTTYATLFAAIGTTYGNGNGTTTFNLPDLRGRIPAGLDNMGGSSAGRLSGLFTSTTLGNAFAGAVSIAQANLPNVSFSVTDPGHAHTSITNSGTSFFAGFSTEFNAAVGGGGGFAFAGQQDLKGANTGTATTGISVASGGSGTALSTAQPTMVMNTIIKF